MSPPAFRMFPLAYHFSLQAYGRWLPGDPRGWHRRGDGARAHPRSEDRITHGVSRELQRFPVATINESASVIIVESISALALQRDWIVYEIATTCSHLHAVIAAPLKGVERLRTIKVQSRCALVANAVIEPPRPFWSRGGFFSLVHSPGELERVCGYVARHRTEPSFEVDADRAIASLR